MHFASPPDEICGLDLNSIHGSVLLEPTCHCLTVVAGELLIASFVHVTDVREMLDGVNLEGRLDHFEVLELSLQPCNHLVVFCNDSEFIEALVKPFRHRHIE